MRRSGARSSLAAVVLLAAGCGVRYGFAGGGLPPPGNVRATASTGRVDLTWSASSGATSYNIYRGTTANGEGTQPYRTGITSTSFADTGLANGSYYYQVVAVNAQGRITLPADTRRSLGLTDGTQLEVRVEKNEIRLRPARLVIAEDAWAYAPESVASIKRSLADIAAGRTFKLTTEDLDHGPRTSRRKR